MREFDFKSVVLEGEGLKATVYRRGARRLVALGAACGSPACAPNHAEITRSVLEATFGEGAERAAPVGKRDLTVVKIGRRKRRVYRVAAVDLEAATCWLRAVGWYVDTVSPPASWIGNDPFGPYHTRDACLADAELAYRYEESDP